MPKKGGDRAKSGTAKHTVDYEYGDDPAAYRSGPMEYVYMWMMGGMFSLILMLASAVVGVLYFFDVPVSYSCGAVCASFVLYYLATLTSKADKDLSGFLPHVRRGVFIATICNYFPIKMLIPESVDLDPGYDASADPDRAKSEKASEDGKKDVGQPDDQYIIGVHPHGIHSLGATSLIYENGEFYKRFPRVSRNLHGAVASVLFRVPFVREIFLQAGYQAADRSVLDGLLARGKSIYIILGGSAESIRTETGKDKVWLHKREGFIRLALKHGAKLVPTYTFYMTDVYSVWYGPIQAAREWLVSKLQICLPIFAGYLGSPIPYKMPLFVAVGEPIEIPKCPADQLEKKSKMPPRAMAKPYLKTYAKALADLFEKHKGEAGYPEDRKLLIEADFRVTEVDGKAQVVEDDKEEERSGLQGKKEQ